MNKALKIKDLIPDDNNFNKGSEYGNSLIEKSFRKFGAGRSILLDKNNRIIAGNKSVENAGAIGLEDVQIIESDGKRLIAVKRTDIDLDSPFGREMALADNATAKANIVFDAEVIEAELGEAVCEEWGVDVGKEEDAAEDGFTGSNNIETTILEGDIIEIGPHRLICGDSFDSDVVENLMDGKKATMLFTDPPYEMDFDYGNTLLACENVHVFIFNNDRAIVRQLSSSPLEFKNFFVFTHNGCAIPQEGGNEAFLTHILLSHEILGDPIKYIKGDGTRTVINGEYRKSEIHKHEKPQNFLSDIVKAYSAKGSLILDLFAGGGSLLSTCMQIDRVLYMVEIDPVNCQNIIDRARKISPSIIIKINGSIC